MPKKFRYVAEENTRLALSILRSVDSPRKYSATIQELQLEQQKLLKRIARANTLRVEQKASEGVQPPSGYVLELLVPMDVTRDFLINLTEIYRDHWVPAYGEKRARRLWHRQCVGLIVRHWFDVFVSAAERLRKVFISWG